MRNYLFGYEDFEFPGSSRVLDLTPAPPQVLHCHNLHGYYWDLRALVPLSQQVPTILTMHDPWLLSGHCTHSFGCERWKTGCGNCPDLTIPPAIRRDQTAYNWKRRKEIYTRASLHVATCCEWLKRQVDQSMLGPAAEEVRVIHNGVDLSLFRPCDKAKCRAELGIPADAIVLFFAAINIKTNRWKDFDTLHNALRLIGQTVSNRQVFFYALGADAPPERFGSAELRYVPYQKDIQSVVRLYQAADVYLHAARADTFPNTILEASACGACVVATAVGGIPEQVEDGVNGFLVPRGDSGALAERVRFLVEHPRERYAFGQTAADRVAARYDLRHQTNLYVEWYEELHERRLQKCSRSAGVCAAGASKG
jgi:glycosyltransferase involved in cell wall biosynthesis